MMLIDKLINKIELLLTDAKGGESDSKVIDVVEEGEPSLPPEDERRYWPIMPLDPRPVRFRSAIKTKDGLEFHENSRLVPDVARVQATT